MIRPIFKRLLEALEAYALGVTATAKQFKTDYASAAKYAAAYKDERRILADKRNKLASKAREDITRYGANLGEAVAECVKELNEQLHDNIVHPVPAATEKLLNLYSTYNLPLSKIEAENLLTVNGRHVLGLRFIASMLEQTKSPYKLSYTPLETYEQDISDLAKFAMMCEYVPAFPVEYLHEAVMIYGGSKEVEIVPKQADPNKLVDSTTGDTLRVNELAKAAHVYEIRNGQPVETHKEMDFDYLNFASAAFSDLLERIMGSEEKPGMAAYWGADLGTVEDISYKDDVTPAPVSGTMIEASGDYIIEQAKEMGKETAKHNGHVSKEVLEAIGTK